LIAKLPQLWAANSFCTSSIEVEKSASEHRGYLPHACKNPYRTLNPLL
jgi:hypothetical protein